MSSTYSNWLKQEIQKRGWKPADLAREAELDQAVISNLIHGKRNPGAETCRAIAKALNIPVAIVYQAAGLLPDDPEQDKISDTIQHLVLQLGTKEKQDVLEYVKLRRKLSGSANNPGNRKTDLRRYPAT